MKGTYVTLVSLFAHGSHMPRIFRGLASPSMPDMLTDLRATSYDVAGLCKKRP